MKFVPIFEALTIKAQKNSPPHMAFEELIAAENSVNEWSLLQSLPARILAAGKEMQAPLYAKRIQLAEMVITKTPEVIFRTAANSSAETQDNNSDWLDQLTPREEQRVQLAQHKYRALATAGIRDNSFAEHAKRAIASVDQENKQEPKVRVSGWNGSGSVSSEVPASVVSVEEKNETVVDAGIRTITGPLEISGGLAVTNEHHIEIRRTDEGIIKELGRVDLSKGQYNISASDLSGTILAKLVDREGKILGEGSFRLNRIAGTVSKQVVGPKIKIEPQPSFAALASSVYDGEAKGSAPSQTIATLVRGASEVSARKDGLVAMDNVMKGSSTVLRTAAPNHVQTTSIIVSGRESKTTLYPSTMIVALQNIIAQQRQVTFEGAPTIIWGKATQDGKALSGIEVVVESDMSLEPIYFNQFLIPDSNLTSTSDNGLFAFVGVGPGFHSLLANRGHSILGYQNVVVEEGSVAQGDIESTMRFESVPIRTYDAFSGEALSAIVTVQTLPEDVDLSSGVSTVNLPNISRLGLIRVKPESVDFVPAKYLYNDNDSFIHLPLIRWSWISAIKNYLRIDDAPAVGVVVGFVPDENFEVYLAGYDQFNPRHIVYFDIQGRILQTNKGVAGGGFIIYNVPEETHEVVVVGGRNQKIYSRVLPVDANSLSVLNFRE